MTACAVILSAARVDPLLAVCAILVFLGGRTKEGDLKELLHLYTVVLLPVLFVTLLFFALT